MRRPYRRTWESSCQPPRWSSCRRCRRTLGPWRGAPRAWAWRRWKPCSGCRRLTWAHPRLSWVSSYLPGRSRPVNWENAESVKMSSFKVRGIDIFVDFCNLFNTKFTVNIAIFTSEITDWEKDNNNVVLWQWHTY